MSSIRRLRGWITGRGVRMAFGIGLLGLLFTQVDLAAMAAEISALRLDLLMVLVVAIFVARMIGALRWYLLLRGLHRGVSYAGILRLTFISDFIGYFTPGSLGIEAVRLYGMARTTSDLALTATSMLIERMLSFLAVIVLVLAALTFQLPGLPPEIGYLAWLALAILGVAVSGLMAPRLRRLTLWALSHPLLLRVYHAAQKVHRSLDQYRARPAVLVATFAISLVAQLGRCAIVAIGAAAFGVHLSFVLFLVIVPVIMLINMLPISIAGLGVRELGFVYLFGQVGVPAEVALSLALLIRVLTILLAAPGAWFYVRRGVLA